MRYKIWVVAQERPRAPRSALERLGTPRDPSRKIRPYHAVGGGNIERTSIHAQEMVQFDQD